jgi:hypothetical protein
MMVSDDGFINKQKCFFGHFIPKCFLTLHEKSAFLQRDKSDALNKLV